MDRLGIRQWGGVSWEIWNMYDICEWHQIETISDRHYIGLKIDLH
jgi:hypothetical protein